MIRSLVVTLGCFASPLWAASALLVEGPWLRAMPPGQSMAAAYMELTNASSSLLTVIGVRTDVASQSVIHSSTNAGGMSGMRPAGPVSIAPGASYSLQPGGTHLMLMGVKNRLIEGDSISVELELDDGSRVTVSIPVYRDAPRPDK